MPSHADNLAAIRAACVAANPEIAELKFGCEVVCQPIERRRTYTIFYKVLGEDTYYVRSDSGGQTSIQRSQIKEIIGREITLPDVLLALGKELAIKPSIRLQGNGTIELDGHPVELRTGVSGWSERTVAYLARLLSSGK